MVLTHWNYQTNAGKFLKVRSEEHTSELQSRSDLVCRLLLEKKKKQDAVGERNARPSAIWQVVEDHGRRAADSLRHAAEHCARAVKAAERAVLVHVLPLTPLT